jgi:hypothetical protein
MIFVFLLVWDFGDNEFLNLLLHFQKWKGGGMERAKGYKSFKWSNFPLANNKILISATPHGVSCRLSAIE